MCSDTPRNTTDDGISFEDAEATIVVALRGEDQERFCRHVLARNHIRRDLVKQALTSIGLGLLFVLVATWLLSGPGWYRQLPEDGVVAILALGWIAFVVVYSVARIRRLLRKFRSRDTGPERVTVSLSGIEVASEQGAAALPWGEICAIETTTHAIYRFVDAQRGVIIPWHAFADEAGYRLFADRARDLWNRARGTASGGGPA